MSWPAVNVSLSVRGNVTAVFQKLPLKDFEQAV